METSAFQSTISQLDAEILKLQDFIQGLPDTSGASPEESAEAKGPTEIVIKMKAGQGYSWLAKTINAEMEGVEGYEPMKSGTLKKRMGAQMLYRNHVYTFPVADLLGGGFLSGGMSPKAVKTAQKGARYWEAEGRERYLAKRDLKEVLEIVEKGADKTKPSQVTQEEFDDAAHDLGDVRLGKGDLTIDTSKMSPEDAKQYRKDALGMITKAMKTETGRTAVDRMNDTTMMTDDGRPRKFLADGTEVTGTPQEKDGETRHHSVKVTSLHQDANADKDRSNDPNAPLDHTNAFADDADRAGSLRGTDGKPSHGSDVTIRMNPSQRVTLAGSGRVIDSSQSTVFVHESAHTIPETQGKMARGKIEEDTIDPTTGTAPIECREDLIDSSHPDIGQQNFEHQAMGVGHYKDQEVSERKHREELQDLKEKQADGKVVQDRDVYTELP